MTTTTKTQVRDTMTVACLAIIAVIGLLFSIPVANAATLYWDTNGTTAGAGATPSGTWDDTVSNWNDTADGTGTISGWSNSVSDTAVFSAGSDADTATITLDGQQTLSAMTIEEGNYTFSSGSLFLRNSSITVNSNLGSQTIESDIRGYLGHITANVGENSELTLSGSLDSDNTITKSGAGTVTFSGIGSADEGFNLTDGTLIVTGAYTEVGGDHAPLSIGGASTLKLGSSSTTPFGTGNWTITSSDVTIQSTDSQARTVANDLQLNNNSITDISFQGAGDLTFSGVSTGSVNHSLRATVASGLTVTFSDNVIISGKSLYKNGGGTMVLNGASNSVPTGYDFLINAGALRVAANASNVSGDTGIRLNGGVLESSGTFDWDLGTGNNQIYWTGSGGFAAHGDALAVDIGGDGATNRSWTDSNFIGSDALLLGSATANDTVTFVDNIALVGAQREINVVDNPDSTADKAVFSGILSGSGSSGINKTGDGVLELTADNNYTGATTITAGTLRVNGTTSGQGSYSVLTGATLGGSGIIDADVDISGTLSPGASVESLETGSLTFNDGSTFEVELDSSAALAAAADFTKVNGNLTLDGTVNLVLADLADAPSAFAVDTTFSLINYTGTWDNGLFTFDGTELADGDTFTAGLNTWSIDYDATIGGSNFTDEYEGDGFVNISTIPEPATGLLIVLGGLAFLNRHPRRR